MELKLNQAKKEMNYDRIPTLYYDFENEMIIRYTKEGLFIPLDRLKKMAPMSKPQEMKYSPNYNYLQCYGHIRIVNPECWTPILEKDLKNYEQ